MPLPSIFDLLNGSDDHVMQDGSPLSAPSFPLPVIRPEPLQAMNAPLFSFNTSQAQFEQGPALNFAPMEDTSLRSPLSPNIPNDSSLVQVAPPSPITEFGPSSISLWHPGSDETEYAEYDSDPEQSVPKRQTQSTDPRRTWNYYRCGGTKHRSDGTLRTSFRCSRHKHADRCPAKLAVLESSETIVVNGTQQLVKKVFFEAQREHNHEPPKTLRLSKEQRERFSPS
eukprot:TRINITY_DN20223_c0_g1_i1.p1 TRINITY_DN20223_c0_g1~~TRINITY_DN20223_c0_g1_i1.p1  ORF type:complete len:226 (-),score=20.90 TRINITY_DN20223_c0_g1_i1:489-1166(-)